MKAWGITCLGGGPLLLLMAPERTCTTVCSSQRFVLDTALNYTHSLLYYYYEKDLFANRVHTVCYHIGILVKLPNTLIQCSKIHSLAMIAYCSSNVQTCTIWPCIGKGRHMVLVYHFMVVCYTDPPGPLKPVLYSYPLLWALKMNGG